MIRRPTNPSNRPEHRSPVVVDVGKRVVEVVEDHPAFRDSIQLGSEDLPVSYLSWDIRSVAPVRRGRDGTIEVNTAYPLFKSAKYGDVFKKLFVVMLVASEKTNSAKSLIAEVARQFSKEFSDLT